MFAAQRAASWSVVRRLVYAAGSPLIPAIRMWRHAPDVFRSPDVPRTKPAFWGYLMLALAECARGECVGYLAGPGNSRQEVFELEFHRLQHLDPSDRVTGL
jgi:hypothetical protein